MLSENIILQSAGSLSVAILALLMLILQTLFFFRKPQFTWYAWSAAISFSALLYAVGIFLEYNTSQGPLNRFSGLLEWTAIICLIHCLYGFTFSYLGIESKRYHPLAGICHGFILILLWSTNYVVADRFTTWNFIGLDFPYIEPALGPLGPVFILYTAIAGVYAMIVWIKNKGTDPKYRITYLAGMGFWLLLGIHDGLASLGVPTLQYIMEYGFLGFAMVVLWVVFNSYLEIAAEDKYRVITEFSNDCILVIQNGKMVFGNPACCDLVGRPLTDSAARDFLDIMVSEDRKTFLQNYNTLLEGGHVFNPHTARIRREDGKQRFVEIASSLIQYRNRPAVLAIMRDITERKRAKESLRESEERLRIAGKAAYDLIYEWDVASDAIEWFGDIDGLLRYRKGEISKDINTWLDLIHPEDRGILENAVELHKTSTDPIQYEYRVRLKDGTYRHWNDHGLPLLNDKGCPYKWVGVCTDITERKWAEEALRKSEEHYRSIFEDSRDAVYITARDGKFIDANQSALDLFGYSREEMESVNALQLYVHPGDADRFQGEIEKKGFLRDYEVTLSKKDGTELDCLLNTTLRRANDGSILGYHGIIRDMTEHKKLEAQLRQAQKMEAIGTLAGGVAHDFNNLLTTIIGNAELGLMDVGKDHHLRQTLEEIKKAGNSAASLTRQLLAFSRKQVMKPEVLDLNEVIISTEKMLKRLIGEDVELSTVLESELWKIHADQGQIEQVIMNLTVNARDAMPQGGLLTFETANIDLDKNYFRKHGIEDQPGSYVVLSVSDTGIGMDKETQSHIFEPFFTSKGMGKGTGLGLSTVYGIIKQNNGFVWVYSEPGQGSTFKIYLSKVKGDVKEEEKGRTPVYKLDGSETVLIVEDHDSLRKLAQKFLQPHGYRVLAAENGEDALRVSKEHTGPIHLMITDVVMPRMGGKEVAERLHPLHPKMKVIYMSGHTDKTIVDHGVLAPGLNFIEKPFSPEGLARKVREVLDKKQD